jgi:signal transduction histidine kinase
LLLALFAAVLVVTILETLVRVEELRSALQEDTRRDYIQFARSLRSVLVEAYEQGGEDEVRRLIDDADATTAARFHISLVTVHPGESEHAEVEDDELVVIEPLGLAEAPHAAIRLVQPLGTLDSILRRSAQISGLHALAVLVASGALMSWLGWLFVGRPVQRLIETTQRIARGELGARADIRQDDELGELARALSAMGAKLEIAHAQREVEESAKLRALEQLRHADRLRSVGQLASGLAHELGTPLNVVSGRARLIETADGVSDELISDARVIRDETAKMTGLVKQLLGFARRRPPEREEADVAGAAARVTQMLKPLASKYGAEIELVVPGGPCVMRGDPLLVEQAITNVAVNGLQSMTKGGRLTIAVAQRMVARPDGGERLPSAVVTLTDDGPGIPDEVRSRIFDPFFTTKDVGEGTGLGLSVVYGIVEDHGGFVQVRNVAPRGAQFELVFPLEGKGASIVPPPNAPSPGATFDVFPTPKA